MARKRDLALENLSTAFAELAAFVGTPELLDQIPEGANIIRLPIEDPELLEHNLKVVVNDLLRGAPKGSRVSIGLMPPESVGETEKAAAESEWLAVPVG